MSETVTIQGTRRSGKATRWRREAERALRRGELDGGYRWREDSRAQRCVSCDCDHDKVVKRNANAARRPPVGTVFVGRRRYSDDGKKIIESTGPLCVQHAVARELYRRERERNER